MNMVDLLKKYKFIFVFLILLLFVISLFAVINSKLLINQNTPSKSSLKGYEELVKSFEELDQNEEIVNNPSYQKLKNNIISLENPKLSEKEKYDKLKIANNNVFDLYFSIKNNKIYVLQNNIKEFTKENFPKLYNKNDFILYCIDPSCSDSSQHEEIIDIINEIDQSSLPDEVKEMDIENLTNYSYSTKDQATAKVQNYYFQAVFIKESPEYKKVGLNIKISDEIIAYLKKYYPALLFEISGKEF